MIWVAIIIGAVIIAIIATVVYVLEVFDQMGKSK